MKLPILLLAAAIAGPAAAQSAISPGYWEMTNEVISPLRSKKVERRCIRPEDVAKFMQGPENHIYRCSYPRKTVANGRIHMVGACSSKDSSIPATVEGRFTADSLNVDAYLKIKFGGLTVGAHGRSTARRLGDACPAETAAR